MGTIKDISNPWRDSFQPAMFAGCNFYCEVGSYECGQRIVIHEFPKKDVPYTELMGRRFYGFTVRGYCIASANNGHDYRPWRDALQQRLDNNPLGMLQLPFMRPKHVVCRQYRLTEEDKYGGYCTFDMTFVEASEKPFKPTPAPRELLLASAQELHDRTLAVMAERREPSGYHAALSHAARMVSQVYRPAEDV